MAMATRGSARSVRAPVERSFRVTKRPAQLTWVRFDKLAKYVCVLFVVMLLAHVAHALVPPQSEYEYRVAGWSAGAWQADPHQACIDWHMATNGHGGFYLQTQAESGTAPNGLVCHATVGSSPNGPWSGDHQNGLSFQLICPAHSTRSGSACTCIQGFIDGSGASAGQCVPQLPPDATDGAPQCRANTAGLFAGNPIAPGTGEKFQSETDWSDSGPSALSFDRQYRSNWAGRPMGPASGLGPGWTHNYSIGLAALPSAGPLNVTIALPEGYVRTFSRTSITGA
ncbi:DUF6531 domain-containing protein, partial [Variovorax defluvii]|uniref:DUF6531 domain-containing protein n=1 Tax=Variovorax defluvii TaxID=913761 RepID=UPI0031E8DC6A